MTSIGEVLQKQRVKQGRTLQEAADALNIKKAYLEALEKNTYDAIPGAVFVKGFIRNYGNYLGLDGAALVQYYKSSVEERTPKPVVRSVVQKKKEPKKRNVKRRQGKWPEITIIAGIIIFLLLMIWIIW